MESIRIACEHCGGTGRVKLRTNYQKAYDAIVQLGGSATTREVIEKTCPWISAQLMNNRLTHLYRLGLVQREQIDDSTGGIVYLWSTPAVTYETKPE